MKKVIKIAANVLSWVLLVFALLITLMVFSSARNNGVANLMGYIPLTVETDSMVPTFSSKDLIICTEIDDIYNLNEDDVITYWTIIDGARVKNTHRIVHINEFEGTRSFITRGDANSMDDDYTVYAGDLIGKWTKFRLPGFGAVMGFLRTKTGFFACILVPMIVFFLYELYRLIATILDIKKPSISEDEEEEIKKRAIEEYLAQQKKEEERKSDTSETKEEKKDEKKPEPSEAKEEKKDEKKPESSEAKEEKKDEKKSEPSEAKEEKKDEKKSEPSEAKEEKKDEKKSEPSEAKEEKKDEKKPDSSELKEEKKENEVRESAEEKADEIKEEETKEGTENAGDDNGETAEEKESEKDAEEK